MSSASDRVRVVGLKEFRKALLSLDDKDTVNKAMRDVNGRYAERIVFRSKVEAFATGRREIIRAIDTVKSANRATGAAVSAGSTSRALSWALAALFGTRQTDQRTAPSGRTFVGYRQFVPPQPDGGPLYRAIRGTGDEFAENYLDELVGLLTKTT